MIRGIIPIKEIILVIVLKNSFIRFIIVIILPKYNVIEDTEVKTKRNIGMYRF